MNYVTITLLIFVVIIFIALFSNNVETLLATITIVATTLIIANIVYRNVYDDVDHSKADGEFIIKRKTHSGNAEAYGERFVGDMSLSDYESPLLNNMGGVGSSLTQSLAGGTLGVPNFELKMDGVQRRNLTGSEAVNSGGMYDNYGYPFTTSQQALSNINQVDALYGIGGGNLTMEPFAQFPNSAARYSSGNRTEEQNAKDKEMKKIQEDFGQIYNGFDFLQNDSPIKFHDIYDKSYGTYVKDGVPDLQKDTLDPFSKRVDYAEREQANFFGNSYLNKHDFIDNPVEFITPKNGESLDRYNKTNCKPNKSSALDVNYLNNTHLNDPTSTGTGNYLMMIPETNIFLEPTPRIFLGDDTAMLHERDIGTDIKQGVISGILSGRDNQSRYYGEVLDNNEIRHWWGNTSFAVGDN
jgi:hypothetical protein